MTTGERFAPPMDFALVQSGPDCYFTVTVVFSEIYLYQKATWL